MNELERLKQQVADMQETIARMEQEASSIEAQNNKKFEWKYEKLKTFYLFHDKCAYKYDGLNEAGLEHGRYRKTIETAKQSLLRNKRANRLEALAEQLDGLKEFTKDSYNYNIYLNTTSMVWAYEYSTLFNPEKVYMTEDCAIKICEMLNEDKFSLDGEL